MDFDVISSVVKRIASEVRDEVVGISRIAIVLLLTVGFVLSFVPWWIIVPVLVIGWGWVVKDHYDAFVAWCTDANEKVDRTE